jgi:DNA-binding CsgD family transcriptional regulator
MLIADDHRRWVTANAAACELFGLALDEVPWHTIDDFTPAEERRSLESEWTAFLRTGAAEGWYDLTTNKHGRVFVEFSATANVLPGRHLTVVTLPESGASPQPVANRLSREMMWRPVRLASEGGMSLTEREREVMILAASGLQTGEMGERLFLSPETVKSHVHNAMAKLGAHTRAHAVAIGLVTGQIAWSVDREQT